MNCFGTIASRITPILLCVLCGCASRVTAAPADAAVDAAEVLDASEDVEDRTDVVATDAGFPEPVPPRPLRLLAAGARHTCAIRAGGRVWCWGINFDGQLGVAGPQSPNPDLLPIAVPDLEDAVELSAGTSFTCALRRSGRVVCWGNNDHGQRGLGFIGPGTSSGPDAEVSGLDDAVSIESGGDFSCARRAGGELVCWGRNQSGQCGRSGPDVLATPSEVNPVGVVEATVGYAHACVRVRTGEVLCWGSNSAGQLGADPGVTGSSRSRPEVVGGLAGVAEVRGMGNSSCARTTDGATRCWGRNDFGQLGDGTIVDRWTPGLVSVPSRIIEVVAGASHACGRTDEGGVLCWGRSDNGATGRAPRNLLFPTRVDGLSNVTALALGSDHSCAAQSDGRLLCWGLREQGVLGDGWYFPPEVQVRPTDVRFP